MTTAYGCERASDLLQTALRVDGRHAGRLVRAAGATARTRGLTDGEFLPSRYDARCRTLDDAVVGLDGLLAAIAPLDAIRGRVGPDALLEADRQLAAFARGRADAEAAGDTAGEGRRVPTPAEIAQFAQVLAA